MTGDIAYSGKFDEYHLPPREVRVDGGSSATGVPHPHTAETVLRDICARLPSARLFLVPGNHDIDRSVRPDAWRKLRDGYSWEPASVAGAWLNGGPAPFGLDDSVRDGVLARQAAYRRFIGEVLGRADLLPEKSAHGRLGYRTRLAPEKLPFPFWIIGLDSSWLAGDESDMRRLRLTEEQVLFLSTDENGERLPGFRLALVHHPLSDLADEGDARRLLSEHVDVLLRGHLHDPDVGTWSDPDRRLPQLAAGCLYGSDRYSNSCQVIELILDANGKLIKGGLCVYAWSAKSGSWYADNSLYRGMVDGHLEWYDRNSARPPATSAGSNQKRPSTWRRRSSILLAGVLATLAVAGGAIGLRQLHREPYEQRSQVRDALQMWEYHILFAGGRALESLSQDRVSPEKKEMIARWLRERPFSSLDEPAKSAMNVCRSDMLRFAAGRLPKYEMARVDNDLMQVFGIYGIDAEVANRQGYGLFADRIEKLQRFAKGMLLLGFKVQPSSIAPGSPVTKERLFAEYFAIWTVLRFSRSGENEAQKGWAQVALLVTKPEVLEDPVLIRDFLQLDASLRKVSRAYSMADDDFADVKEEPGIHFLRIWDQYKLDERKLEQFSPDLVWMIKTEMDIGHKLKENRRR